MKLYNSKEYLLNETKIKTYSQIAEENNVNVSTIFRKCKKFGLTKPAPGKWTKGELEFLEKDYAIDRNFFSRFKTRSLSSIYHKTSRNNIKRLVKPLNYKIDENFFCKWSKELAYFLGFFMADGYINTKKRVASIKIQKRDEYILHKFLKLIKTNRPIRYHNNYPILRINNSLILKNLIKSGCKPGDSLNNSYPKEMPEKYFFHFLRGYIDGDGSIYICKSEKSRQKNVLRVSILGSKEFLQLLVYKISYYLNKKINYLIIRDKRTKVPLHKITFNGKLARLLCYELYWDCEDLYLKRKREKFKTHLNNRN